MAAPEEPATAAQRRNVLPDLLARVMRARDHEDALGRGRPCWRDQAALDDARLNTLDALVDYAGAIEALSWPVPRSILQEIRMHRILCDPRRP